MDTGTIAVVGILALIIIAAFMVSKRTETGFKIGPLEFKLRSSNDVQAAIRMKGVESGGAAKAEDKTGRGVEMTDVKAKKDVVAKVENNDPKA